MRTISSKVERLEEKAQMNCAFLFVKIATKEATTEFTEINLCGM